MIQELKKILKHLRLNTTDVRVFIANFQLGDSPASSIARQAGINRITAYETLKRLGAKGFVKTRIRQGGGVCYFEVEDISVIKDALHEKMRGLSRSIREVENISGAFHELYIGRSEKPAVLFYEGKAGINNVLLDTLRQKPIIILSFGSSAILNTGFTIPFLNEYWKKRVAQKIPSHGIIQRTPETLAFFTPEKNQKELRRAKFISPERYLFKNEIDIYGDNISIISLEKGREHGVIIRSRNVAQGLRSIFEFMWSVLPDEQ